jgi:hypothetical protein
MNPSKRWHVAAIVVGSLGFLAVIELLVIPQYAPIPEPCTGYCMYPIEYEVGPTIVRAVISFLLWAGVVYLVWLVVSVIRWAIGRVRGGGGRS